MFKIYGYCRISRKTQDITRQARNILEKYPSAVIKQEVFTGTTTDREEYKKLKKILKSKDTVVFDSVSRMSRNADEGIADYKELMDKGINLIFLKEPYINTDVYGEKIRQHQSIKVEDEDLDATVIEGIRKYLVKLAEKQIRIAFEQAEKEVKDLQQRTKEGMKTAKLKGNIAGRREGATVETKKAKETKEKIKELSKDFNGSLSDKAILEKKYISISRNSFYKYKRELIAEQAAEKEISL